MTTFTPTAVGALFAGVLVAANVSLLLDVAPAGWLAVPVALAPVVFALWLQREARVEGRCRHCADGTDGAGRVCLYCHGTRKYTCRCPDQRKQFVEVA